VTGHDVPRLCVVKIHELNADADRRLVELHRSLVQPAAPRPRRRMPIGVAVPIAGVGLFLYGWTNSSRTPDGRTLLAVALVGLVVLLFATGIVRYRRREREDAARTADLEKRLQQSTSTDHYLDGAS
jgi:hypothetical protein